MDDETLRIRSYRVCFELERRIHRIERWRIPVPYGVPLRGIAYGAIVLLAVLVLRRLPVTGQLLAILHPALQLVVLPIGVSWALVRLRVDGRPAHAAAVAWLGQRARSSRVAGFRPAEPLGATLIASVAIAPDERGARYCPGRVAGPAAVTLRYPAQVTISRRRMELRQSGETPLWRGRRVVLAAGQELRVR